MLIVESAWENCCIRIYAIGKDTGILEFRHCESEHNPKEVGLERGKEDEGKDNVHSESIGQGDNSQDQEEPNQNII